MDNFAPVPALAGGILIGLSVGVLWLANGRIAGISGIFGGVVPARPGDLLWRLVFIGGLILGGAGGLAYGPAIFPTMSAALPEVDIGGVALLAAGLLVGIGTRLGGGCTSGHGVCGLARLSPRSFVAVAVFMTAAMAVVFLTRHVL